MNAKALDRWLLVQAMLWLVLLVGFAATHQELPPGEAGAGLLPWTVWPTVFGVTASYVVLCFFLKAGKRLADWVTLGRFALIASCCGWALAHGELTWLPFAGLVVGVCCDLLDGYVARRFGPSAEGAVLDMETDQLVTLSLAVVAVTTGLVGAWALVVPAFRYGYVIYVATLGFPPHDPKPREGDNSRGRLVCALMMASLLAALLPCMPALGRDVAAALAVLLLGYSFGSDMIYLAAKRARLRARRKPASRPSS